MKMDIEHLFDFFFEGKVKLLILDSQHIKKLRLNTHEYLYLKNTKTKCPRLQKILPNFLIWIFPDSK